MKNKKKALENKIISFELNLYFIGEGIYPLYQNLIVKNNKIPEKFILSGIIIIVKEIMKSSYMK